MPMPRVTADNLWQAIDRNVAHKTSLIVTDQATPYGAIGLPQHETVKHRDGEYVRGAIHTNTMEGFFSMKRGINGVYHHVSEGHLNRYCDEFAFRYENRKISDGARATALVGMAEGKRLTFSNQQALAKAEREKFRQAPRPRQIKLGL